MWTVNTRGVHAWYDIMALGCATWLAIWHAIHRNASVGVRGVHGHDVLFPCGVPQPAVMVATPSGTAFQQYVLCPIRSFRYFLG